MNWTAEQYREYIQSGKKASKYRSKKTWVDGLCFDSRKEADYYCQLKMLVRAGEIDGFIFHGKMIVAEGTDKDNRATTYEPDFVVLYPGQKYEIVDTKGVETQVFKVKVKALRCRYPKLKIRTV